MKTTVTIAFTVGLGIALAACSKDPKTASPTGTPPANQPAGHGDEHGAESVLGTVTIGAHTFEVTQLGEVEAGKEAHLDLEFPASRPMPGIVRAWIGVESGQGSMKGKLGKEGEHGMHGHLQVPKPIPAGSKIWIEIEEGTNVQRGSIAWK